MTNFISEHISTVVLVAVGAGGVLLAGGAIFRIERSRRLDKEVWMREVDDISAIIGELLFDPSEVALEGVNRLLHAGITMFHRKLGAKRNEICLLRQEMNLLQMRISQIVNRNGSGSEDVGVKIIKGGLEAKSRASSTVSLESNTNYVDASDTWFDAAPATRAVAGGDLLESQKDFEANKIAMIDDLLERNECQQVYHYIQQLPIYSCDDPMLLWRYAKACYLLSKNEDKGSERRENLIKEGKMFACKAYEIDSDDFDSLKWFTLLTGAATDYYEVRKRIEEGQIFKNLLDKALAVQPEDYVLLHLRGRYLYAVVNLSWMERTIVTTVFGAPLTATVDEALDDFLKVEQLKPDSWIDNLLYIAKCYLIKNDELEAIKYLKKASSLNSSDETEKETLKEVFTLLKKLNH